MLHCYMTQTAHRDHQGHFNTQHNDLGDLATLSVSYITNSKEWSRGKWLDNRKTEQNIWLSVPYVNKTCGICMSSQTYNLIPLLILPYLVVPTSLMRIINFQKHISHSPK